MKPKISSLLRKVASKLAKKDDAMRIEPRTCVAGRAPGKPCDQSKWINLVSGSVPILSVEMAGVANA